MTKVDSPEMLDKQFLPLDIPGVCTLGERPFGVRLKLKITSKQTHTALRVRHHRHCSGVSPSSPALQISNVLPTPAL